MLNGFEIRNQKEHYEPRLAMDMELLWKFLLTTQETTIAKLIGKLPKKTIINIINQEIIKNGLLFSLKDGVYLENKKLDLMYRTPATSFNEKANKLYSQNILSVMEEVNYENEDRIDLVVFLNGLALFTIELKYNPNCQNNVEGKISDERFIKLSGTYEQEQIELTNQISELSLSLTTAQQQSINADHFLKLVKKCTDIQEVDVEIIRQFVDKIIVHKAEMIEDKRQQKFEIIYNCVGAVEILE